VRIRRAKAIATAVVVFVAAIVSSHAATQSGEWLARSLVGSIAQINDDGTLTIQVAEESNDMMRLSAQLMLPVGAGNQPLGVRVYRLAGTEVAPALNETRLQALRQWLVGTEVNLRIGSPFSANDAPEPVPAVIFSRRGNAQLNEQFVRRGFGQVRVDVPEAIGSYEWLKIVAAAQH